MQILYISNRPRILADTLLHVERLMPFVEQVLVLGPEAVYGEFSARNRTGFTVNFVSEERCMPDSELKTIRRLGHQSKNYALRARLVKLAEAEPEFLMSDDDSRPLRPVSISDFKQGGKYRAYFFYDLNAWSDRQTNFGAGQCHTGEILKYFGMPTLSYASHMPQIISKPLYLEAAERFSALSRQYSICEWSSYFNHAIHNYPSLFHNPEPFRTLCWPDTSLSWPLYVEPENFLFENYYPEHYEAGGPFHGLRQSDDVEEQNPGLEKIVLWRAENALYTGNRMRRRLSRLASFLLRPVHVEILSRLMRLNRRTR